MSEFKRHVAIESSSERSFGWVFATFFLIVALYPATMGEGARLWALLSAAALMLITCFSPVLLKWPNQLWFRLGLLLGAIVSPLVMGLVYFLIVTPTALLMKLTTRDPMARAFDKTVPSYWIKRERPFGSMKDQF